MKRIFFAVVRLALSVAALAFTFLPWNTVTVYLNDVSGIQSRQVSGTMLRLLSDTAVPQLSWALPVALAVSAILALISVFPILGKLFNWLSSIVFAVAAVGFIAALVLIASVTLRF